MRLLVLDPSGSYKYGKGTTGIVLFDKDKMILSCGSLRATKYDSKQAYFKEHNDLIKYWKPDVVVIENFKLQSGKALGQDNKELETSELIGSVEQYCFTNDVEFKKQSNVIKSRWKDYVLEQELINLFNKNIKIAHNIHERDALRHFIHFYMETNDMFKWVDEKKGKWNG